MADPARDLEFKVLLLSAKQRARLAERLIASLDEEAEDDAVEFWMAEAERRLTELDAGRVEGVPAERAFEKARSRLR